MNVRELKTELEKYPDNMDIYLAERKTEFAYGLANSIKERKINLSESPDSEILATENVLIIDEE
jgi:hypothetical protein